MPTRTPIAPWNAVTDRNPYPEPTLPVLGPAGFTFPDPTFQTPITRVTDALFRSEKIGASYQTPSTPHTNAFSSDSHYFWLKSTDGTILILPTAAPSALNAIRPGGYIEPQFSYVQPGVLYQARQRTVLESYTIATGAYRSILDTTTIGAPSNQTYIGYVNSSNAPERVCLLYGGSSQGQHHLVAVIDPSGGVAPLVLDTLANTLNGSPIATALSVLLHSAAIDRTGRYVFLYANNQKPPLALWDLTAATVQILQEAAAEVEGHDCLGFAQSINQDVQGTYDAVQWQHRSLITPFSPANVLPQVLRPQETYIDGHPCWNNARPDSLQPFTTELYQYGQQIAAGIWRAGDNEIIGVAIDGSTVWRFCHHRSDVRADNNLLTTGFWYEPRANVSPDGRWIVFTSNWEKTLGADPNMGDPSMTFRQDVFLLALQPAAATPAGGTVADAIALLNQAIGILQAQ